MRGVLCRMLNLMRGTLDRTPGRRIVHRARSHCGSDRTRSTPAAMPDKNGVIFMFITLPFASIVSANRAAHTGKELKNFGES